MTKRKTGKKCCQCGAPSVPGLKPGQGLCQTCFNRLVHGVTPGKGK